MKQHKHERTLVIAQQVGEYEWAGSGVVSRSDSNRSLNFLDTKRKLLGLVLSVDTVRTCARRLVRTRLFTTPAETFHAPADSTPTV